MDHKTLTTLAENIEKLRRYHDLTQMELAIKSSISQKTISNILNPGSTKNGPTLENVAAIAAIFNLETWHLLVPNQPIDVLISKSIEKLIDNYTHIDNEGRQNLERISENEVRYCSSKEAIVDYSQQQNDRRRGAASLYIGKRERRRASPPPMNRR